MYLPASLAFSVTWHMCCTWTFMKQTPVHVKTANVPVETLEKAISPLPSDLCSYCEKKACVWVSKWLVSCDQVTQKGSYFSMVLGRKPKCSPLSRKEKRLSSGIWTISTVQKFQGHGEVRKLRNHWEEGQISQKGIQIECVSWYSGKIDRAK